MLARSKMADPSELVDTILTRTREGKLSWEELSSNSFLTRVGQTMIVVDQWRSDGLPYLRITDESGKILETIGYPIYTEGGREELLSTLHELARRQALKVDETLSDLKRSLDKL
jgi:hypothetical protein